MPDLTPEELKSQLETARQRQDAQQRPKHSTLKSSESAISMGFRLVVEFIAPIAVMVFLGYFVDKWLDSSPFALLIMGVIGFAAGIANIIRTALGYGGTVGLGKAKNKKNETGIEE